MTYIENNHAPIIIGNYIEHQEIYIDKQLNIVNGNPERDESSERNGHSERDGYAGTDESAGKSRNSETNGSAGTGGYTKTNGYAGTDEDIERNGGSERDESSKRNGHSKRDGYTGRTPVSCMGARVERLFGMAEERGLLSRAGNGYVWNENDTLLDYFLGRTLCGDYPCGESKPFWCFVEERKVMPVDDMNRLFGRSNIGNIRRNRKDKPLPNHHERIDNLFDAIS